VGGEVDPVSWTLDCLSFRSPQCARSNHLMRRSSGGRCLEPKTSPVHETGASPGIVMAGDVVDAKMSLGIDLTHVTPPFALALR
jgi:hypothetical protein